MATPEELARAKGVREERVNKLIFKRMDNSPYTYSYKPKSNDWWDTGATVHAHHPKHGIVGRLEWEPDTGEVGMLAVASGHENLGVGLGMYGHAIGEAYKNNIKPPSYSNEMTGASIGVTKKVHPDYDFSKVDYLGKRLSQEDPYSNARFITNSRGQTHDDYNAEDETLPLAIDTTETPRVGRTD